MTVADLKVTMLAALEGANRGHGDEPEMRGLRQAIEALPDRAAMHRLPAEVRQFMEQQLSACSDWVAPS